MTFDDSRATLCHRLDVVITGWLSLIRHNRKACLTHRTLCQPCRCFVQSLPQCTAASSDSSVKVMVFFYMMPCSFGRTCCIHLQDRMIASLWNVGNKLTALAFIAVNSSGLTFQIFASESAADCTGLKEHKNWTSSSYLRRYNLVWCDYVRLLAQWGAVP